jgi:hypothetical protein
MRLEDQVCALEYSKRLDELGVKRESLFYHQISSSYLGEHHSIRIWFQPRIDYGKEYHAYTVAELGEMLPNMSMSFRAYNKIYSQENWLIQCSHYESNLSSDSEANARAKMLIHLIENGYVKVEELNND